MINKRRSYRFQERTNRHGQIREANRWTLFQESETQSTKKTKKPKELLEDTIDRKDMGRLTVMSKLPLSRFVWKILRIMIVLLLIRMIFSSIANKLPSPKRSIKTAGKGDSKIADTHHYEEAPVNDAVNFPEDMTDFSVPPVSKRQQPVVDSSEMVPIDKRAYVTLCGSDADLLRTLTLFQQLRRVNSKARFGVLLLPAVTPKTASIFEKFGIEVHAIPSSLNIRLGYERNGREIAERDRILWNKLWVWTLTLYEKVVLVDTDVVVKTNIDGMFSMEELSGSPMITPTEKIAFYHPPKDQSKEENWWTEWKVINRDRPQDEMVGKYGLNSGLMVLKPSMDTYHDLLDKLASLPKRLCCPTQEFLFRYFESKQKYHRLPKEYHVRLTKSMEPLAKGIQLRHAAKIYHYVTKNKPFELYRKTRDNLLKLWQVDARLVHEWLQNGAKDPPPAPQSAPEAVLVEDVEVIEEQMDLSTDA